MSTQTSEREASGETNPQPRKRGGSSKAIAAPVQEPEIVHHIDRRNGLVVGVAAASALVVTGLIAVGLYREKEADRKERNAVIESNLNTVATVVGLDASFEVSGDANLIDASCPKPDGNSAAPLETVAFSFDADTSTVYLEQAPELDARKKPIGEGFRSVNESLSPTSAEDVEAFVTGALAEICARRLAIQE